MRRYHIIYGAIGIVLALGLVALQLNLTWQDARNDFTDQALRAQETLTLRLAAAEELASGMASHLQTLGLPDGASFRNYLQEPLSRQHWVSTAYFMPIVDAAERSNFVYQVRRDGFVMFDIWDPRTKQPVSEADAAFFAPIRHLEPLNPDNAHLLGLNALGMASLRTGVRQAIRHGEVQLVELRGRTAPPFEESYFLLRALYAGQETPNSETGRVQRAIGIAAVQLDPARLTANLPTAGETTVEFTERPSAGVSYEAGTGWQDVVEVSRPTYSLRAVVTKPWEFAITDKIRLAGSASVGLLFIGLMQLLAQGHTKRYERARALRESELRFRGIFEQTFQFIALLDVSGRVRQLNRLTLDQSGKSPTLPIGEPLWSAEWIDTELKNRLVEAVATAANGETARLELEVPSDGTYTTLDCSVKPLLDETGNTWLLIVEARDITDLRVATRLLAQERDQVETTLRALSNAVVTVNRRGLITYINRAAETLLVSTVEELLWRDVLDAVKFLGVGEDSHPVTRALETGSAVHSRGSAQLLQAGGSYATVEYSANPIKDEHGEVRDCVLVVNDVTETQQLAERISYQATHDSLTGLFNRREFERHLEEAFQSAKKHSREHVLLYLDLDQFKLVNDTCGHVVGDRLLRQLTRRLANALESQHLLARLGGDEFGLLATDCSVDKGAALARQLLNTVREYRFYWNQRVFQLGVSIGLVPVDKTAESVEQMLSVADTACFAAKDAGRNRVQIYRPGDVALTAREQEMLWVPRLNEAIRQGQFLLYRQPVQALRDDHHMKLHEVLMRLADDRSALVVPSSFLPAAERFGLMTAIDSWVVRQVLQRISDGNERYSINLSGQSITEEGFIDEICEMIRKETDDPRRLVFEITETAAMTDVDSTMNAIQKLRRLGCGFALDDFGTGLSSFAYLKRLPVEFVKIDGVIIEDVAEDAFDRSIITSINDMAHSVGKFTIAERVETPEMLEEIRLLGVDFAQGTSVGDPTPWPTPVASSASG